MESALLGLPRLLIIIPVDESGHEHWDDEEPALLEKQQGAFFLRYSCMCVGAEYTLESVNVYNRQGGFLMNVKLEKPLFVVRMCVVQLAIPFESTVANLLD